jgi:predicted unusual protein kinase regulating ubiquinone biosynthesis (AarF/ABC1/UbiB family)
MKSDVGGVIDCAIELGFLPENADVAAIQPEIQKIFDNAQMTDILQEVKNGDSAYTSIVTRRKRFMAISYDLNRIFFKYPFFVPDYFALMTRTMIVLEGIAVTGDPAFDLFGAAYPYALKRAVTLFGFKDLSHIAVEAVKIYKKP